MQSATDSGEFLREPISTDIGWPLLTADSATLVRTISTVVLTMSTQSMCYNSCGILMVALNFLPNICKMSNQNININNAHNIIPSRIGKLKIDNSNKELGRRHALSANQITESKHRLKQCHQIASKARITRIIIGECYKYLSGWIIPAMTYSFSTSTFNKQCQSLNTIIDEVMVNKLWLIKQYYLHHYHEPESTPNHTKSFRTRKVFWPCLNTLATMRQYERPCSSYYR